MIGKAYYNKGDLERAKIGLAADIRVLLMRFEETYGVQVDSLELSKFGKEHTSHVHITLIIPDYSTGHREIDDDE